MEDVDAVNCHRCYNSLTRPEIRVPPSPIHTSISTRGLSPSQAAAVDEALYAVLTDVSQIDHDILRYQTVIEQLEYKRELLMSFAKTHSALLTPILRFPPEVLSEIFQHCMEFPNIVQYSWPQRDVHTPVFLASVCRSWRAVMLAHPKLWSSIALTLRPKDIKRHIALLDLYFSRSASHPLCLYLESQSLYQNDMRNLMRTVASKSDCWEHIRFRISKSMWRALCPDDILDAPVLDSVLLSLFHEEEPLSLINNPPIDVFYHVPSLRRVHFEEGSCLDVFPTRWDQVEEIILEDLDWTVDSEIILDVLTNAPNLVKFDISLFVGSRDTPQPIYSQSPRAIHLPNLTMFSMCIGPWIDPTGFLSKLCMPAIEELALDLEDVSAGVWQGSLHGEIMFIASLSRLRKLDLKWSLHSGENSEEDIIRIIRASPNLRELRLIGEIYPFKSATILASIAELSAAHTPILAPNLEILSLRLNDANDIPPFVRAIKLRSSRGSQSRLRDIYVASAWVPPREKQAAEQCLLDVGVKIYL